jgi:hypothetical protein
MGIIVGQTIDPRTLLTAVKRILTANGHPEPTTVDNATGVVQKAVQAVNDAQDEIYVQTQWQWRFKWWPIELMDSVMWYPVPDDFGEMAVDIPFKDATSQIDGISYHDLCDKYPYMRHYPTDSGVDLSLIVEASASDKYIGSPKLYTVWAGHLGLIPRPDAEYVTEQGGSIVGGYYKIAQDLYGDSDAIDMPKPMWRIHHNLANAYYKQYMEFSDWQATEQRALAQLQKAVTMDKKTTRTVNRMRSM